MRPEFTQSCGRAALGLAVAIIVASGPAGAQEATTPAGAAEPTTATVDETDVSARIGAGADAFLRAMSDYLAEAQAFTFQADETKEVIEEGLPTIESHRHLTLAVSRPDRLRIEGQFGGPRRLIWIADGLLTEWTPDTGTWAEVELPGDLDDALDQMAEEYDNYPPIGDLLYSDLYVVLTENVQSGGYAGLHEVNGVLCHHLVFQQESIDWQIWIDAGLQRLPRRIAIHYKSLPGQPRWSADLYDWDLAPRFPVDLFTPTIPASANKIDILPIEDEGASD